MKDLLLLDSTAVLHVKKLHSVLCRVETKRKETYDDGMKLFPNSRMVRIVLVVAITFVLLTAVAIFWLSHNLTHLVEQNLRRMYGQDLSLGRIETGWNRVVLYDLRLRHPGGGPVGDRIRIEKVVMTPRFRALLSRRIEIDLLRLEAPRVLIEIASGGNLISPLTMQPVRTSTGGAGRNPFAVAIGRVEIDKGELIYLDRSSERLTMRGVSNPGDGFHLFRLTDIWFHTERLEVPLKSAALPVTLVIAAPGPGSLRVDGLFNPVTRDADLKITLHHWDLTKFRPYFLKRESLDVTGGFFDCDATIAIAAKKLHAPGEVRIKGLEVARTGNQGAFMGMSAKALLAVMKDDKGEIRTTFLLDGDLENPRFKTRQSLTEQISGGIARKLGVPVVSDVGSGMINLGKKGIGGLKSLFGGK